MPQFNTEAFIEASGSYTVTVDTFATADRLVLDATGATLNETSDGALSLTILEVDAGTAILHSANTINGNIHQTGGVIQIYDSASLGAATDFLDGGELTAMASVTLDNNLFDLFYGGFSGVTIDAAAGTTLDIGVGGWTLDGSNEPTLTFGSATRTGNVIWHGASGSISGAFGIDVAGGTLTAGDANFQVLTQAASLTTIQFGANLDLAGFDTDVANMGGEGNVVNSGGIAALTLHSGTSFGGFISGAIALNVNGLVELSGSNTYVGSTTIVDAASTLLLSGAGSIVGNILDNGGFDNQSSTAVTPLTISGTGYINQDGSGSLVLKQANSFSGGTNLSAGTISIGHDGALGTGEVGVLGGEIVATVNTSIGNDMVFTGTSTIAATFGKTLTLGSGAMTWNGDTAPVDIVFGDATHQGTIILAPGTDHGDTTNPVSVEVAYGTLKIGSTAGSDLISNITTVTVDHGAKLDLNGFGFYPNATVIAGAVTNSSNTAAQFQSYVSSTVSGAITGNLNLWVVTGTMTMTGASTYKNGTAIANGAILALGDGHAGGTILAGSAIEVDGTLIDNHSSAQTLSGDISGLGTFVKNGSGATTLSGSNSYSGGTIVNSGTLVVGIDGALGSGAITLNGGELLSTLSTTIADDITFTGTTTVAAGNGRLLTLASGDMTWDASGGPLDITFGDASHRGGVFLSPSDSHLGSDNPITVTVAYGTLVLGSDDASGLISNITTVTVRAGARLDTNGNYFDPNATVIAGTLTNTSLTAASFVSFGTSSVTGKITGNLGVEVIVDTMTLTGANTYTGGTTIDDGATLNLGTGHAGGTLLAGSAIVDNGTLVDNHSRQDTLSGTISGAGSFIKDGKGTTTLSGSNSYSGGTTINSGTLVVGHGGALGTGAIAFNGGKLFASVTTSLANDITFVGKTTVAASTGNILTLNSSHMVWDNASAADDITFGDASHKGTVVLGPASQTLGFVNPVAVTIAGGTLKIDSGGGSFLLSNIGTVTVDAGATLDINGIAFAPNTNVIAGTLTNSSLTGTTFLSYVSSDVSGAITGNLAVEVVSGQMTLTGANTYTGGTKIDAGTTLYLGDGHTGGTLKIGSAVIDNGALVDNHSVAETLSGIISGSGSFTKNGNGATTLSGNNTYSGGTTITKGVLIANVVKALGTGGITLTGGELLAGKTMKLAHDLHTGGTNIIAAAHGTVLTLANTSLTVDAGLLVFGDGAGDDGSILFSDSGGLTLDANARLEIRAGTLLATADGALDAVLLLAAGTKIDGGAVLDANGTDAFINSLTGSGTLTNSGSHQVGLFGTTNFAGVVAGTLTLEVYDTATLSGNETFTGILVVKDSAQATLSGLFGEDVSFEGTGTLVLPTPAHFTGDIVNFHDGDFVDLKNINAGAAASLSYNTTTHVLTVGDGTHNAHLTFAGTYSLGNFVASSDLAGGTDIGWQESPAALPPHSDWVI